MNFCVLVEIEISNSYTVMLHHNVSTLAQKGQTITLEKTFYISWISFEFLDKEYFAATCDLTARCH